MQFSTKAVHAGYTPDELTGAVMPPVHRSATYMQNAPGEYRGGYHYSRLANPTRSTLETAVAELENGKYGMAFASGMAAIDAVMRLLLPGDEVITTPDLYGGSFRLFTEHYQAKGIVFKFSDFTQASKLVNDITPNTKLLWFESPTNPLLSIFDIKAISKVGKEKGVLVCIDNTFASPFLQNPLDFGADIVCHSGTKYLGGHSDVLCGMLVTNSDELYKKLRSIHISGGAVLSPDDSYLVIRGIKTLHLRMERHCENAMKVAEYLQDHPAVNKVHYPGLPTHPGHLLAKAQMPKGFGGMVSFNFKSGKKEDAYTLLNRVKLFTLAESLGGVESLCGHPASMSNSGIPYELRMQVGITEDLIRLSIGVEDAGDLINDLHQALNHLNK